MARPEPRTYTIGLISDTHGLLRPGVFEALAGVERIFHAGDVGGLQDLDDILIQLQAIAPVEAVFGNTDPPGHPRLRAAIDQTIGGLSIHVSHGHEVGATPARLLEAYPADVIVYGHTHRQLVTRAGGRLAINPGAAGPRRFELQASIGRLTIRDATAEVEIIQLG